MEAATATQSHPVPWGYLARLLGRCDCLQLVADRFAQYMDNGHADSLT